MSDKPSPSSGAYFRARADECSAEALASPLENVRLRFLRAEAAWLQMADRTDQRESNREVADAAKRARDLETASVLSD